MNIDKRAITNIEKTNESISKILSKIESIQDEELSLVLEEIKKLKIKKKKEKKKDTSVFKVEKKLLGSFQKFEEVVSKKPKIESKEKIKFQSIIPNSLFNFKKQSSEDYSRKGVNDLELEKLKMMKSISRKLDFEWKPKKEDKKKDPEKDKSSSISDWLSNISTGAGLASLTKYGKRLMPVARVAYSVKSLWDLFGTIKSGINDYKTFKSAGNDIRANDVLMKTVVGGVGNLMNAATGVMPLPYAALFMPVAEFLEYTSKNYDTISLNKNDEIMARERKVLEIEDMIAKGEKNEILQLRPNGEKRYWEFKNYSSNDWEPLIDDKTKKPLSILQDKQRVVPDIQGKDGIQTYKLKTDSGALVEMVVRQGMPQIKVGDNYSPISTRQSGGNVNKGQQYLVGEAGPEGVRYSDKANSVISFNKSITKMIEGFSLSKWIRKLEIRSEIPFYFFKPTGYTVYGHGPDKLVLGNDYVITPDIIKKAMQEDKMTLDFNNIPTDDRERSKAFSAQMRSEEGGYSNNKNDKGGKTNFGVTQISLDEYFRTRSKKSPAMEGMPTDVKNITKEQADEIYYHNYYLRNNIKKYKDPALAYLWFVSYAGSAGGVKKWEKDSDKLTFEQLSEIRKKHFFDLAKKDPTQKQHLHGWLGRDIRAAEMVRRSREKLVVKSDTFNVSSVQLQNKTVLERQFMLNTIAPAMANVVNEEFN